MKALQKRPPAIRIAVSSEVKKALQQAKQMYPTLSDAEILKLGLAKMVTEDTARKYDSQLSAIRCSTSQAVGYDYLGDSDEDIYDINDLRIKNQSIMKREKNSLKNYKSGDGFMHQDLP
jgi:hypothetical protein